MGLLFTYGMTYGGAATALFNPYICFLIYVCFGIIRPPDCGIGPSRPEITAGSSPSR